MISVIRAFDEFSSLDDNKIEEMWNIVLFEEPDYSAEDIDKDNLIGLLDMLYEEWVAKENSLIMQSQAKAFASSDVLDILQTINSECFKNEANFEVSIDDIEKSIQI